ncbi:hypothetical protein [Streptomyces venezuelae]|uniref:hypothetical protein n=1 Tax=Streptomyces venezuelae TaxID=54571 RepID=UPI00364DC799
MSPPHAVHTADRHAIFLGYHTLPGQHPFEVLETASCSAGEPWSIRLHRVDEQACEIATWSFPRGAFFKGPTAPVSSRGVALQPAGFALLFTLGSTADGGRRSLVQLDRAEVIAFLVRCCLSDP